MRRATRAFVLIGCVAAAGAAPDGATAVESSPLVPWNLDMADAVGSGYDGTGVTIAVLDYGLPQNWADYLPAGSVDSEHAAGFGPQGHGSETAPVDAGTAHGATFDLTGHGLAVCALLTGFRSPLGTIRGVAPGARILPLRIVGRSGTNWDSWATAGVRYVTGLRRSGALSGPIVMLYGASSGGSTDLTGAIDDAIAAGIVFVAVAGNDGPAPDSVPHPGSHPAAITVGTAGWVREAGFDPSWIFDDVPEGAASEVYVAGTSGRGAAVDLLAPGVAIYSLRPTAPGMSAGRRSEFEGFSNFPLVGTTVATTHVAGIAAQMLQKNPGLTQAQVESILRAAALAVPPDADGVVTPMFVPETPFGPGAVFWGPWGADATGAGLVRGAAAVAATPAP